MLGNPYTPGAGCIPPFIAGRESVISNAELCMERLKNNYPQRSIIYYGLRGVGKTVLLNTLEQSAENLDIKYDHIEASESKLLLRRLLTSFHRFLRQMSIAESASSIAEKCVRLLASFAVTYDIREARFGIEFSPEQSTSSGILEDDLTEIMVTLGRCAKETRNSICLFIDEFQYVTKEQAKAIVTALHRCNQLRLPIMFFCAGLPKVVQVVSNACSYAERIFIYEEIGKLSPEEASAAIVEPAAGLGVSYDEDAVAFVSDITEGYPYFIQEFCSVIWELADDCDIITRSNAEFARNTFFERLDAGFFAARMSRCAKAEKNFMLAMAECGGESCTVNDVAHRLEKDPKQISPVRGKLIDKGMIYAPSRGALAFTVPLFGNYLLRTTLI